MKTKNFQAGKAQSAALLAWAQESEQAYYTVRYYNASGIGVEMEWKNVYGTEAEAKDYGRTNYRIGAGNAYRLYAFKQDGRIN